MSKEKLIPINSPEDNTEVLSVKVAVGEQVRRGSTLFTYKTDDGNSAVKSHLVGVVKEIAVKEGACINKQ